MTAEAPPWEPVEERTPPLDPLPVEDLADLLDRVTNAPVPRYLVRPIIAAGDHGMFAAEFKAGKTWALTDMAVSVASATPWLGIFEIEAPGPVLVFAGEGGARKIARRFRAVCDSRRIDPSTLPVRICLRVPHLTNDAAMLFVEGEIAGHHPALVIVDPLYLAARGARGSDLYEMGAHLERIQVVCQRHGAALVLSHHWNKTGEGRGAKRMTGAGPDAWGRVLISAAVVSRHTDPTTQATSVVLDLDVQGDEVAESTTRIRRRVWADDPNDLASALHYEVERLDVDFRTDESDGLTPSARRVLAVLEKADDWTTVSTIGDRLADDGQPLKVRTIQAALAALEDAGRVRRTPTAAGSAGQWCVVRMDSADEEDEDAF